MASPHRMLPPARILNTGYLEETLVRAGTPDLLVVDIRMPSTHTVEGLGDRLATLNPDEADDNHRRVLAVVNS